MIFQPMSGGGGQVKIERGTYNGSGEKALNDAYDVLFALANDSYTLLAFPGGVFTYMALSADGRTAMFSGSYQKYEYLAIKFG